MLARNFTERLVARAIWSREDPLFSLHRQHGVNPPFEHIKVWYNADFEGVVFCLIPCPAGTFNMPFIPIVGVRKRGAYQCVHGKLSRQHPFGTTFRFTGPVSADSRQ